MMKDIYLVNYSVRGMKTLDQLVSLSFYKKTISRNPETQGYNIKGIYGTNGSGKSGIIASVDILRNLIINPGYLNNPMVQKSLDAMINKKTCELFIEVEFIAKIAEGLVLFRYEVTLSKDIVGKYVIGSEMLSVKDAVSKSNSIEIVFKIADGEITDITSKWNDEVSLLVKQKTMNLLSTATLSALFYERIFTAAMECKEAEHSIFLLSLLKLLIFGTRLYIYLDQSDNHTNYIIQNSLKNIGSIEKNESEIQSLLNDFYIINSDWLMGISVDADLIPKSQYASYEKTIKKLYEFLHIFKTDLRGIEIDKKEDQDAFICSLVMVYDSYKINVEFESTGIKKLIRLYAYVREMVRGGIVFIDEFDSNLHDVYLCALLEYLVKYGEGQLCFTTHNVGPMDVLKQCKKSIDFLSVDHRIYSWTTNGNYSPARLYRNGMIEGMPFNVDSIDFIGVFDSEEDG